MILGAVALAALLACQPERGDSANQAALPSRGDEKTRTNEAVSPPPVNVSQARDVEWLELMPSQDRNWLEAQIDSPIEHVGAESAFLQGEDNNGYARSFGAVTELQKQRIRIAGYVVPIELTDQGAVSELLFVPYMGACVHVPAPPPNQIISAKLFTSQAEITSWEAYWLEGVLRIENTDSALASSLYRMEDATLRLWEP